MDHPHVFWNTTSYSVVPWDIQHVSMGDPHTWCQLGLTKLTPRQQRWIISAGPFCSTIPHWNTLEIKADIKIFVVFTDFQNWNYLFCFALNLPFQSTQHQGERHRQFLLLIPLFPAYIYSQIANLWAQVFTKKLWHTFSQHHKPHCCSTYTYSRSGSDSHSICNSATQ